MFKRCWAFCVCVAVLLGTSCFSFMAKAADQPADIRILVDISGSMKYTDPNNLRIPAVNLLTELIPDGSQAGIWTFGQYVNNVLPSGTVNRAWRQQAKQQAAAINSVGLFTNLTGVINDASWNIGSKDGFAHSLILLTDGYIDMPGNAGTNDKERERLLKQILSKAVAFNTKIHTLALSNDVDKALLQQLSAATGGLYLEAHSAEDLSRVFLKAFDRAVPTEQVPLVNNQFNIDTTVQEFTAVVFNKNNQNTQLITPSGQALSQKDFGGKSVRWYQDLGFELITVKNPEVGQWQIDVPTDPDNRVQILTDMKLQVSGIPATFFVGNALDMQVLLSEQGKPITMPELLRTTDIKLTVTAPDGRVGSKILSNNEQPPRQGIYHEAFTRLQTEGEYRFEVTATGKTFERRQLVTAALIAPLKIRIQKLVEKEQLLIAFSPDSIVDIPMTRLNASITSPTGSSALHEIKFNSASHLWEIYISADQGPGTYQIELAGRITMQGGLHSDYHPQPISITFPLGLVASAPNPQVQESFDSAPSTGNIVLPDLANQYEQQQAALKAKVAEPEPSVLDQELDAPSVDTVSLWWYVGIAGGAMLLFAGLAFLVLKSRRAKAKAQVLPTTPVPAPVETASPEAPAEIPEDLIQEDIAPEEPALEMGDFDNFEGEQEVEIPLPKVENSDGQSIAVTTGGSTVDTAEKDPFEDLFAEELDQNFALDEGPEEAPADEQNADTAPKS